MGCVVDFGFVGDLAEQKAGKAWKVDRRRNINRRTSEEDAKDDDDELRAGEGLPQAEM